MDIIKNQTIETLPKIDEDLMQNKNFLENLSKKDYWWYVIETYKMIFVKFWDILKNLGQFIGLFLLYICIILISPIFVLIKSYSMMLSLKIEYLKMLENYQKNINNVKEATKNI